MIKRAKACRTSSGRAGIGGAGFVDLFHRAAFCFQLIEKALHVSLYFHDQHARMYATGARQVDTLDFSHADIAEFTLATTQGRAGDHFA